MLKQKKSDKQKTGMTALCQQITYQKLFWLFLIGSVVGIAAEGLWCILTKGTWEYHPATVWGPFCIIYGVGAIAVYIVSIILKGKKLPVQFICYTIAGGLVEYVSSWVQELLFHSTSWDYSSHFLNIGGRVSLQMAAIWGFLGVAFMYSVMPLLERLFEKTQGQASRIVCVLLTGFMVINLVVTSAALVRWRDRQAEVPATNQVARLIDDVFDDEFMEKRYCNMKFE